MLPLLIIILFNIWVKTYLFTNIISITIFQSICIFYDSYFVFQKKLSSEKEKGYFFPKEIRLETLVWQYFSISFEMEFISNIHTMIYFNMVPLNCFSDWLIIHWSNKIWKVQNFEDPITKYNWNNCPINLIILFIKKILYREGILILYTW